MLALVSARLVSFAHGVRLGRPAVLAAFALLAAALMVPVPAAAQGPDLEQARATVQNIAERGVQDIVGAEDVPHAEKIARFRDLFATHFDIPSIGQFVLARTWRTATPDERERFLELFRELQIYTWARRFGEYSGQELRVTGAVADGDRGAIVSSRVDQDAPQSPISVEWRLRLRGDDFKVVDLIVEGVSMAITYRSDYGSILQRAGGSMPALLDRMDAQLNALKAEQEG